MSFVAIKNNVQKQAQVNLFTNWTTRLHGQLKIASTWKEVPMFELMFWLRFHYSERRREEIHKVQVEGSIVSFALQSGLCLYANAKLKSRSSFKQGKEHDLEANEIRRHGRKGVCEKPRGPSNVRERVQSDLAGLFDSGWVTGSLGSATGSPRQVKAYPRQYTSSIYLKANILG